MARRAATKYGDKTAIIFRDLKLSFYDLEREARRFANLMTSYGVKKGDRVAVYAYNSHYYPISMIGLAKIGAIQVPINYMLNAEEIAYIINHSGSRIFIVEDILYPIIAKDQDKFSAVEKWGFIPLDDSLVPEGFFNLIAEMEAMPYDEPQVEVSAEDIVQIPYTSGTESKPKGAMLSHRALMSQYHSCIFDGQYETDDVSLHALPLFHCAQLHCFLMPYLYIGATNVIMHKADPLEMIRLIEKYQITHMFAPPTVWIGILNHPEFKNYNHASLKKAAYGASIMPVEIIKQLSVTFRGLKLWNYYGQTEMGPVATILKPEDQLLKPGSAGKPVLNVETRLMDDDGKFVPVGDVGEIVHRSGHVMTGYLNDPEKTAEAFRVRLVPQRRSGPVRRGRLPLRGGPQEGHDQDRRRKRGVPRSRGGALPASGHRRGGGHRPARSEVDRDCGGRGRAEERCDRSAKRKLSPTARNIWPDLNAPRRWSLPISCPKIHQEKF